MKNYEKNCPKCNKKQYYRRQFAFNFATKNNLLCQSCCKIGKSPTNETRHKLSVIRKGNNYRLGSKHSGESKNKMRMAKIGNRHPMFGKKGKLSHMYGKKLSEEHRENIRLSLKGIPHTKEHNRKIRISSIEVISKNQLNGGQLFPRYNPIACKFFDKLSVEKGWDLQHAENGGEYYISELGYWLDAYDRNKNIVVEYDEKWHGRNFRKKKDFIRRNDIIHHLNPNEFWVYKEDIGEYIRIL